MKVETLMNKLEDMGKDREVYINVNGVIIADIESVTLEHENDEAPVLLNLGVEHPSISSTF